MRRSNLRNRIMIGAAVLCILAVAVTIPLLKTRTERQAEQETLCYHMPMVMPITGTLAYLGEDAVWGAQYAVDEINASGGIGGIPIQLDVYDTGSDYNKAKEIAKNLVNTERIVVGPVDSTSTSAIMNLMKENGIANIAAYSYESARKEAAPYGISYMSDTTVGEFEALRIWSSLNRDIRHVTIVINANDSSQAENAALFTQKTQELNLVVDEVVSVDLAENNGLDAVADCLNTGSDGFIIFARYEEYIRIITELRRRGITEGRRFTASFSSYEAESIGENIDSFEGSYIWNKFNLSYDGEQWQKLLAAYQDANNGKGPDSSIVSDLYDVVYAWKRCIEELGLNTVADNLAEERGQIVEWFYNSREQDGIQGQFQWENGEKISPSYYFQFDRNGKMVHVEAE